jgi:hypothetical protein
VMYVLVVTSGVYKWSIYPFTNPNPVYSLTLNRENIIHAPAILSLWKDLQVSIGLLRTQPHMPRQEEKFYSVVTFTNVTNI